MTKSHPARPVVAINPPISSKSDCRNILEIRLLGGLTAKFNGFRCRLGKKQGALLAFLALNPDGIASREQLVGLLWSSHYTGDAKRNLRQLLKNLRDQLRSAGFSGLETPDSSNLCLVDGSFRLDVKEILETISSTGIPSLLLEQKAIHESLLPDFDGIDPEYDSWLQLQRHSIRDRLSLRLENNLSASAGASQKKIAIALNNIDPTNEVAVRALMKHYAIEKNVSGALRIYKELCMLLDDEYGMDPATETEELAVRIKLDQVSPDSSLPPAHSILSVEKNVAPEIIVEKFNTDLIPKDQVYIANGFRHDLLASLARFRDWRVVEKSLRPNKGESVLSSQRQQYLVRAQTYMDQSVMHLVFTVIDKENASVIWSQKYVVRMESWLVTQSQIIRNMAVSLNINISADRLNAIWRHREIPAALHDRWLLGQSHVFRWNPESSSEAEKIFRDISVEAPEFAPAFSSLVQIENSRHLVFPGKRRKGNGDQSTIALARKAVQIDPLDSKAHLCMAWSLCLGGQFEEALRYFNSAISLNENDPWTIVSTAQGFSFCGLDERAQVLVNEADELGLSLNLLHCAYQVGTKFLYGDYKGAVDSAEIAGDVISNVRGWKCAALSHLGLDDQALHEGQIFIEINRANWHGVNAPPKEEEIVEWFLHCFPIRKREKWRLLRDGLAKASLPIPEAIAPPH